MSYQNLDGKVRVRAGLSTTYSVLAIAIASATSMSAVAAPAAKNETTVMETVVVTGSVIGNSDIEDVKEYPGARTVITRDQIEKTAAGSIDNALQRVPGIKVQDESGTGVL
ncbi:tonB-dependent Receptor Plug domain protein, partial [Vibrio parahaemolyticus V-223/04]